MEWTSRDNGNIVGKAHDMYRAKAEIFDVQLKLVVLVYRACDFQIYIHNQFVGFWV